MGLFFRIRELFSRRKPQPVLGIALGSGGAKGMAHLGILKAFEEEGITFSVVTGASIGAIVGALYAQGYSSADMVGIVESLNTKEFAKNLRPFADLSFAESYLSPYVEGDITELKKPFAASVTHAKSNQNVILRSGNAARALTASAAIPPFFRGVEIDGVKYYDGAFSNAVPADACRELGAEFVVGVDLAAFTRSEEEKGRLKKLLGSAISAMTPVKYLDDCRTRGYEHSDFMLRPNLLSFSATDVSRAAMSEMFEVGYKEAKEHMAEIKSAIEEAARGKKKERKKRK